MTLEDHPQADKPSSAHHRTESFGQDRAEGLISVMDDMSQI